MRTYSKQSQKHTQRELSFNYNSFSFCLYDKQQSKDMLRTLFSSLPSCLCLGSKAHYFYYFSTTASFFSCCALVLPLPVHTQSPNGHSSSPLTGPHSTNGCVCFFAVRIVSFLCHELHLHSLSQCLQQQKALCYHRDPFK